jgi:hypothetical protein
MVDVNLGRATTVAVESKEQFLAKQAGKGWNVAVVDGRPVVSELRGCVVLAQLENDEVVLYDLSTAKDPGKMAPFFRFPERSVLLGANGERHFAFSGKRSAGADAVMVKVVAEREGETFQQAEWSRGGFDSPGTIICHGSLLLMAREGGVRTNYLRHKFAPLDRDGVEWGESRAKTAWGDLVSDGLVEEASIPGFAWAHHGHGCSRGGLVFRQPGHEDPLTAVLRWAGQDVRDVADGAGGGCVRVLGRRVPGRLIPTVHGASGVFPGGARFVVHSGADARRAWVRPVAGESFADKPGDLLTCERWALVLEQRLEGGAIHRRIDRAILVDPDWIARNYAYRAGKSKPTEAHIKAAKAAFDVAREELATAVAHLMGVYPLNYILGEDGTLQEAWVYHERLWHNPEARAEYERLLLEQSHPETVKLTGMSEGHEVVFVPETTDVIRPEDMVGGEDDDMASPFDDDFDWSSP